MADDEPKKVSWAERIAREAEAASALAQEKGWRRHAPSLRPPADGVPYTRGGTRRGRNAARAAVRAGNRKPRGL